MKRHSMLLKQSLLVTGLAILAFGCAVDGGVGGAASPHGATPSQPAARLGLAPVLRPFYDELEPYGDWVLVEPYGWVFRPRVNTVAWRPYQDGHWEPSYTFGWVWDSNEPFGWITDHYGFWFRDEFQGWVWQPYGAWAPSWVAWVQVGDFVGWAPLPPEDGQGFADVPDGLFTYVPRIALAQAASSVRASFVNQVPDTRSDVQPIDRMSSYRGVTWNAGPALDGLLGPGTVDRLRSEERTSQFPLPESQQRLVATPPAVHEALLLARTRTAVRLARAELAAARAAHAPPAPSPGDSKSPAGAPADGSPPPRIKPAPADSTDGAVDSVRVVKRRAKPQPPKPDDH